MAPSKRRPNRQANYQFLAGRPGGTLLRLAGVGIGGDVPFQPHNLPLTNSALIAGFVPSPASLGEGKPPWR